MTILVTGCAGFIGFHVASRLLSAGEEVVGIDAMTAYYDLRLKQARVAELQKHPGFAIHEFPLQDRARLAAIFDDRRPTCVVHLAAQAGVRFSLENPDSYIDHNIVGTLSLLETLRSRPVNHLLIASSSSVYGANGNRPYEEADAISFPLSPYAATKVAVEALSHSYSHLYTIPTTCFRFFTVYGPWGRPDMALYKFVDAIENGRSIDLYGDGRATRDLTSVFDLADAVLKLRFRTPRIGEPVDLFDSLSPGAPWRTVNIAGNRPVRLIEFVHAIERATGKTAKINFLAPQPGDASDTQADIQLLRALIDSTPATTIDEICRDFVDWYRSISFATLSSA